MNNKNIKRNQFVLEAEAPSKLFPCGIEVL
jgi:hypothetical protein